MLKYQEFINESKIDSTYADNENKHRLLFSETISKDFSERRNEFPLFYQFYLDSDVFYGLRFITDNDDIDRIVDDYENIRFTLLLSRSYRDTEDELPGDHKHLLTYEGGRFNLSQIIENKENYYFYKIVEGPRNNNIPNWDEAVDFEQINEKRWIFVIRKESTCSLVKTESRESSGTWAERHLSKLYGWKEDPKKIKLNFTYNGAAITRANGLINTVFNSTDADIFEIEDNPETCFKYDLVMPDGKKIEVKKYNIKEIWKNNAPVPILLAQQIRMASRETLVKIVRMYRDLLEEDTPEYDAVNDLVEMQPRELQDYFDVRKQPGGRLNPICTTIKAYYNSRIRRLVEKFNAMNQNLWMQGIYGIYFCDEDRTTRKRDFLVKVGENGVRNFNYFWREFNSWLGFNELKLFMTVKGEAWEYILSEWDTFVRTFQVENHEEYLADIENGEIDIDDKTYKYNDMDHYWVEEPKED